MQSPAHGICTPPRIPDFDPGLVIGTPITLLTSEIVFFAGTQVRRTAGVAAPERRVAVRRRQRHSTQHVGADRSRPAASDSHGFAVKRHRGVSRPSCRVFALIGDGRGVSRNGERAGSRGRCGRRAPASVANSDRRRDARDDLLSESGRNRLRKARNRAEFAWTPRRDR